MCFNVIETNVILNVCGESQFRVGQRCFASLSMKLDLVTKLVNEKCYLLLFCFFMQNIFSGSCRAAGLG